MAYISGGLVQGLCVYTARRLKGGWSSTTLNLLIVWLLTGLWHGADWTFIIWGLSYGLLILLEKAFNVTGRLKGVYAAVYQIFVLVIVDIEWMFFKAENVSYALTYLRGMFAFGNRAGEERAIFLVGDYLPFIIVALLCAFPVLQWVRKKAELAFKQSEMVCVIISRVLLLVLFFVSISFIVAGANNPFAYANF